MKIIRNRFIPFKGFTAINIFGIVVAHHDAHISSIVVNHERIHTAQMKELGFVFFYVFYFMEWLVRLFMKGSAYRNISFEREAYDWQDDLGYLPRRRHYAWIQKMCQKKKIS